MASRSSSDVVGVTVIVEWSTASPPVATSTVQSMAPSRTMPAASADPNATPLGILWVTCSATMSSVPRFRTVMTDLSVSPAVADVRPSSRAMLSCGAGFGASAAAADVAATIGTSTASETASMMPAARSDGGTGRVVSFMEVSSRY